MSKNSTKPPSFQLIEGSECGSIEAKSKILQQNHKKNLRRMQSFFVVERLHKEKYLPNE